MTENHHLEGRSLRRAFDQAARSYDRVAGLQRHAAHRLIKCLDPQASPHRILDLGCGTGHGASLLAARYPRASLVVADIALSMVRGAREVHADILPLCADAQALPLRRESVDLLWSNLMLQWCNDLPRVFAQLHAALCPGGTLAFSTFGPATLQELRGSFDDGYTHVNRFRMAEEVAMQLVAAGFVDLRLENERCVLYYDEVTGFMRGLQALGARNATQGRARGLTGRTGWRRMLQRYEALREAQGLPATYDLIYLKARKP
jgi:malonyl-CoA O-methyltransferase